MLNPLDVLPEAAGGVGIIQEVYKDLAQPGVRQVGKALKTVLELANNALLPVRILNETARQFEEAKFRKIKERFSKIPEENIVEVAPEIGVPIMERLSFTSDKTLADMFVELLAKAAELGKVDQAHPSFVTIISSLSPDEAHLLRSLMGSRYHPFISIDLKSADGVGTTTPHEFILKPPRTVVHHQNLPLYLSNLIGLGLIEARRGVHLTEPGAYDEVINYAKKVWNVGETMRIGNEERKVSYGQHVLVMLPYGEAFLNACITTN